MNLIIPIEFHYLTSSKTIIYDNEKLYTDYLLHFMDRLIMHKRMYKTSTFNLSSRILIKRYTDEYPKYVKFLIKENFITKIANYSKGRNCIRYKIVFPFTSYINISINNKRITDRHNRYLNSLKSDTNTAFPLDLLPSLEENLNHVNIDVPKALNLIYNSIPVNEFLQRAYSIKSVYQINSKEFDPYPDKHGRFHSNITRLNKDLRPFINIDGNELSELDIKTSQYFFLAVLMKEYNDLGQYDNFIDTILNDDLYQFMLRKYPIYEERKKIKKPLICALFDDNMSCVINYNDMILEQFGEKVYSFIKRYEINYGIPLWKKLQGLESEFIFNKIYRPLDNLGIRIITIHDSILFDKRYEYMIKELWFKEKGKLL